MSKKEFTVTTFAEHIGRTKQNISQLISKKRFSFPGYRLEEGKKRTKIIKIDRQFLFYNAEHQVIIIAKAESPELAVLNANDLLFDKKIVSFRFRLEDAREIDEKEVLISNLE